MPHIEKDQQRLKKLLGVETFNKMKQQINNITDKTKRIGKIEDFLDIIKSRLTIPTV